MSALAGGTIRVLLVEDSDYDAILARRALAVASVALHMEHVDTLAGVQAALLREWDVVLCDYAMPALELNDVLGAVAAQAPGTPVVVVSGTVGEEVVAGVMRRGVADVVLKSRLAARLGAVVLREAARVRGQRAADAQQLRIASVLGFFGKVNHWREAIEASVRHLGISFRASAAVVDEMDQIDLTLRPIALWAEDRFSGLMERGRGLRRLPAESVVGQVIMAGEPRIVHLAEALAQGPGQGGAAHPMLEHLVAAGMTAAVCQPIIVSQRRFCLTVLFAEMRDDLAQVASDMAAVSATLQPVLFRKLNESRLMLLDTALDAARSAVMITEAAPLDHPGPRIVYANEAVVRMTGHARDELLGQTPRILQGADTDRAVLATMRRALETAQPVKLELANYRRDGTPFLVEIDLTPVREHGAVTHFIAVQTDITNRRKLELEQREREASFRLLFENNPMPMWVFDRETLAFLEVNAAAIAHYGWSRAEFLARGVADLRPDNERESFRDFMRGPQPERRTTMWTHTTGRGEVIEVRTAVHAIAYQGRPARLVVVWDVTEMEQARRELRHQNAALAETTRQLTARTNELLDATELARIGTWSMQLESEHRAWSAETFAILGQEPGTFALNGAAILACVHPDDRAGFRSGYRRVRERGVNHQMEYRILRPDGEERVLRELARPTFGADGQISGIAGVVQDITEQKVAEAALLRSEKLKTLGQVTGGIAHDFNNLLTVIGLNIDAVLEFTGLPEDARELLEPALEATHRGAELNSQLLSFARRQALRPEPLDVDEFLLPLRAMAARSVGERYTVEYVPHPSRPVCRVDRAQLEAAILNLIVNARDAMPGGGRITIATAPVQVSAAEAEAHGDMATGAFVTISVTDQGTGMSAALLSRVFEPFFTTKEAGKGTGLGLSMVMGFAKQSGGHVNIDSQPGKGTSVRLYLPAGTASQSVAPDVVAVAWQPGAIRTLVVEDRDDVRDILGRLCSSIGLDVVLADSAEAALAELAGDDGFDLLFTDIVMPGRLSGIDLGEAALRTHPRLKVLYTSGFSEHGVDIQGRLGPAAEFLPKPYRRAQLVDVLRRMFTAEAVP